MLKAVHDVLVFYIAIPLLQKTVFQIFKLTPYEKIHLPFYVYAHNSHVAIFYIGHISKHYSKKAQPGSGQGYGSN